MWWLPGVESVPWCVTLTSPTHSPLPETTSLKLQTTSSSPLLVRLESVPSYVYSVVLVKFSLIAHCIVFNAVRAYPMSFKFPCWFFVLFFWKKHLNKCAQNIAIVTSMPETLLASMPQILPYEVLVHPFIGPSLAHGVIYSIFFAYPRQGRAHSCLAKHHGNAQNIFSTNATEWVDGGRWQVDDIPAHGRGDGGQGDHRLQPPAHKQVLHQGPAAGRCPRLVPNSLHPPRAGLWGGEPGES